MVLKIQVAAEDLFATLSPSDSIVKWASLDLHYTLSSMTDWRM